MDIFIVEIAEAQRGHRTCSRSRTEGGGAGGLCSPSSAPRGLQQAPREAEELHLEEQRGTWPGCWHPPPGASPGACETRARGLVPEEPVSQREVPPGRGCLEVLRAGGGQGRERGARGRRLMSCERRPASGSAPEARTRHVTWQRVTRLPERSTTRPEKPRGGRRTGVALRPSGRATGRPGAARASLRHLCSRRWASAEIKALGP